jgi:membrane-bound lytic murein transglycosylase B
MNSIENNSRGIYSKLIACFFLLCLSSWAQASLEQTPTPFSQRTDVHTFIQEMVKNYGFQEKALDDLFNQVKIQPAILASIAKPKETQPWYSYKTHFLTQDRINKGVHFWRAHEQMLARAEKQYGVPASIIVAILGIETYYGQQQGNYRVIDALSTLAFNYPPRATFFRKELGEYLLLTRENHFSPLSVKGSYAGAMGQPQFMPSSYRHYAVSYNGDSPIDLQNKSADAISSVANYLKANGWQANGAIIANARVSESSKIPASWQSHSPILAIKDFQRYGISVAKDLPINQRAMLIRLDNNHHQPEYLLGLNNFRTIMRYNTNVNYAMAVYELSQGISNMKKASPIIN